MAAMTWDELELPALRWVLRAPVGPAGDVQTGDMRRSDEPAEALPELTELQLDEALRRLQQHGLVAGRRHETSDLVFWTSLRVTADGLRVLGEWPPEEPAALTDVLVRSLRSLAGELPEDDATAARRAGSALGKFSTDTLVDVLKDSAKRLGEDAAT